MSIRTLNIHAHFVLRTGMHISPVSKETICAFITGYEIRNSDKISERISKRLSSEYSIENRALGWAGQINEYAQNNEINWISAFNRITLEVIVRELNDTEHDDFYSVIRDRIKVIIDDIDNINDQLMTEWIGLVNIKEPWFQFIWENDQFEIIEQINDEILSIYAAPTERHTTAKNLIKLKAMFTEREA